MYHVPWPRGETGWGTLVVSCQRWTNIGHKYITAVRAKLHTDAFASRDQNPKLKLHNTFTTVAHASEASPHSFIQTGRLIPLNSLSPAGLSYFGNE